MEREKIALYTASLRVGGVERAVVNLAAEFARRGYPVDIVLARAEGALLAQAPRDAPIVDLMARQVSTSLPRLVRYLRAERPAALLTLQTHCNVVGIASRILARQQVRVVVSEQNSLAARARRKLTREAILLMSARWAYPHAGGIVAVSSALSRELAAHLHIEASRVTTIYNPVVDAGLFAQAGAQLDHPWFTAEQPPVLLSVGRLVPQKDHATLVRAFARFRERRLARLVILGEGPERGNLEGLVQQYGLQSDVSLPGFDTNPFRYMRRASAFVLSSAWEGFGNVLVEAMACGAPVISTDCPSGPAEILGGGRYGPLVPVGDDEALARAIEETFDSPKPSELLRQRADTFSVERSADAYLRALLPVSS